MQRILLVAVGVAWFGFLFVVTFFLTFPTDAVVERARWEVAERSNGQYSLALGDLGPWWLGAAANDVKLYNTPRTGDPTLALLANDVRVKAGPFSLLSRAPSLSGSITPIDGTLYFTLGTARGEKKGDLKVNAVGLTSDGFPLSELLLLSGTDASGVGGLDIDIEVAGENSLKGSDGHIRLEGGGLTLSDLEIPGVGPLGMDVPIDRIDIDIDVQKGKATIKRGDIDSSLLKAELSGNILLMTTLERSTMNVEILLSDLGPDLQPFAMMLDQAETKPGSKEYKFTCTGAIARPRCDMGEGRSRRTTSRDRTRPPRPTRGARSGDDFTPRSARERPDAEELKRKREERLERLRKLREERAAEVRDRELDDEEFDDEPLDGEEFDELDDEEFLEDDEEFLDDEEFFDDEG